MVENDAGSARRSGALRAQACEVVGGRVAYDHHKDMIEAACASHRKCQMTCTRLANRTVNAVPCGGRPVSFMMSWLELGADHTGVGTKYQYEGTRKTALEAAQAQGEHAVAAVLHAWAAGTRDATELDRLAVEATPREDPGGGPTRGGDDY